MSDIPLFLVCLFASTTTVLLISVHIIWLALLVALRKQGCRVTHLHHNWEKIRETISFVNSPEERRRYETWVVFLQFTYWIWALAMVMFTVLALFISS
ncbi:MAG: hypothetical protein JXN60_06440 [Lentisphaerae bacterium]|nr:hypothetical protein [Lentisphaerota bacterium]